MPTHGERRALIFIAGLAALGVAARGLKELRGPAAAPVPGDRAALARQIDAVDSALASSPARRRGRGAHQTVVSTPKELSPTPPLPRHRGARSESGLPYPTPRTQPPVRPRAPRTAYSAPRAPRASLIAPPVDLDTATPEEIATIPAIGPALARRIVADRIEHGPFGSITGLERVPGIGRALARRFQAFVTFSLPARADAASTGPPVSRKRPPSRRAAPRP